MSELQPPLSSPMPIESPPPSSYPPYRAVPVSLVIPPLECPFPADLNPGGDTADAHTLRWVKRHALGTSEAHYRRFARLHAGHLAARTTPHAPPTALQIVTDWCSWFFIHDDYCDEGGSGRNPQAMQAVHDRFREILSGATPLENDIALTHALHELWGRTLTLVSTTWRHRFIANMHAFFEAAVWEATNRAKGETPPLADYLRMRPFTGGMFAYMDLVEMSESLVLPPELRHHPLVQQLSTMTANIVSWANDVLSLPKELKQGDIHNVVFSMQQSQKLTVQEAIDRAVLLHNQEVERFIEVETALPRLVEPQAESLKQYVLALRTIIRGSLDWLSTSMRYQVNDN
jgi:5-epi-alpha-selinene synthase